MKSQAPRPGIERKGIIRRPFVPAAPAISFLLTTKSLGFGAIDLHSSDITVLSPSIPTLHQPAIRLLALRPYALLALCLTLAFAAWALVMGEPAFPLDDAYITIHNADVLLRGHDPNYGVSPLVGATSSIHLLLVAALGRVFGLVWATALATWLAAGAYLGGLMFMARRNALSPGETAQLLIAGALSGFFSCHLLNGLETGLAMAILVWSLALALEPRGPALPVLLGLLPFVRPELAIFSIALGLERAWQRRRAGEINLLFSDAAIAALAAMPWLLWMLVDTGSVLPLTISAKRYFFADDSQPLLSKLSFVLMCATKVTVQTGVLAVGLIGLGMVRAGRAALLAIIVILALYAVFFPIGASHNEYRYLYVLAATFPAGLAIAMGRAAPRERRWLHRALIACATWAIVLSFHMLSVYAEGVAFTRQELAGMSKWVEDNVPADARIAVHDAGYIAYANDRAMTDIVGLKTPFAAKIHAALTSPSSGLNRVDAVSRILRESRSNYLVVLTTWDEVGHITSGLKNLGWQVERLRDGAYRVVRITPPATP